MLNCNNPGSGMRALLSQCHLVITRYTSSPAAHHTCLNEKHIKGASNRVVQQACMAVASNDHISGLHSRWHSMHEAKPQYPQYRRSISRVDKTQPNPQQKTRLCPERYPDGCSDYFCWRTSSRSSFQMMIFFVNPIHTMCAGFAGC
jgi:hypothetical protein